MGSPAIDVDASDLVEARADVSTPQPGPVATPMNAEVTADGIGSGGVVPGAYLPPSTAHRAADASTGRGHAAFATSGATAEALAVGGTAGATSPTLPSAIGPTVPPASAGASGAAPARPATPGRASILADLPFDAPDELEGWLVTLGGGIGILGFLLPWRSSLRTGLEGYLDSWGLGIGAHLPIFFLVFIVTALVILPNRVASWVRTGVCGMVVGGLLLGLVWLYLGGGAEIGAILTAVAGVLLVAGGALAVAPGRGSRTSDES